MRKSSARRDLGWPVWGRWQTWAILYAVTISFGVIIRLHRHWATLANEPAHSFLINDLLPGLPLYLLLNPLRIVVAWFMADRFRFDQGKWRRNGLIHLGASLALAHVYLVARAVSNLYLSPLLRGTAVTSTDGGALSAIARAYVQGLSTDLQPTVLWYWAVLGVYYAYHYYLESHEQRVRAAELQTNLMEARFERLRSQLSPHFLFNTLNTISVLALRGDREATSEALELLGNLLRTTLDDKRPDRIAVWQEAEFIRQYLDIQQLRFSGRLTTHFDIASDTANAEVPAMVLQPIVENAVKYGVLERAGAGSVSLRTWRDNGTLLLQVTDTGPGFSAESTGAIRKGIGLRSTEARLEHVYGQAYRIEYGSSGDGGAVTISVPFSESVRSTRESER
jgi:two-component system, LytTR family, sensor kinase